MHLQITVTNSNQHFKGLVVKSTDKVCSEGICRRGERICSETVAITLACAVVVLVNKDCFGGKLSETCFIKKGQS